MSRSRDSRIKRRNFLKLIGAALAAPAVPAVLKEDVTSVLFGEAMAEEMTESPPTYFVEINLRDQWDFGHVFVPPGLATTFGTLRRGTDGRKCALFNDQLHDQGNGFYLTEDSLELAPHLDDIAVCEVFELSMGRIHGHEAANATRSPGRSYDSGAGRMAMYEGEPGYAEQGNEPHFSSTPTPASLHNYWQKQLTPGIRNGVTFKGVSRAHTAYHFGAGLPGSELDRKQSVQSLLDAFPDEVRDLNILETPEEAQAVNSVLSTMDARHAETWGYTDQGWQRHQQNINEAQNILYSGQTEVISLPLTDMERTWWSEGVPEQVGQNLKCNIWEQAAYAFKLLSSGMTRTFSIEFDYIDVHDVRTDNQMQTMARQTVLPLTRLIESFKAAGMWDNTVIAIYSLDGGRAPAAGSYGSEGKNTVVLAGGGIRGGYYGDVGVAGDDGDGHRYSYTIPDINTGNPSNVVTDNGGRIPGASIWKTVMKALKLPVDVYDQFPDVVGHKTLDWMLEP